MSEAILTGDFVLTAKTETEYGVDSSPTAAANAMRVKTNIKPIVLETEEMDYDAGRPGAKGTLEKSRRVEGDLQGYLAGSGTATTPVPLVPLLKSAGLAVNAQADHVAITPAELSMQDSSTLAFFRGKHKHLITGWRSDWEIKLSVDSLPRFNFPSGKGLFTLPEKETGLQNADLSAFLNPLPVDPVHFVTQQIFGNDVSIAEVTIKGGNTVQYIPESNEIRIIDRKVTISILFREPMLDDVDFYSLINTYGAINLQLGQDTVDEGRIFEGTFANAQMGNLETSERNGQSYLNATFDVVPTARNNDFTFKTR